MKLEVGKYYLAKDGSVIYIESKGSRFHGLDLTEQVSIFYYENGKPIYSFSNYEKIIKHEINPEEYPEYFI